MLRGCFPAPFLGHAAAPSAIARYVMRGGMLELGPTHRRTERSHRQSAAFDTAGPHSCPRRRTRRRYTRARRSFAHAEADLLMFGGFFGADLLCRCLASFKGHRRRGAS